MKKQLLSIIITILFIGNFQGAKAQAGAALNFNGSNNYIDAGTLNLSSYTKEAWIYANGAGSNNIISSNNAPFWLSGGSIAACNNWASIYLNGKTYKKKLIVE